jgi:sterol desaturase/sphingolipid hydroxylase (fatty acid hydroxylase superfamily)
MSWAMLLDICAGYAHGEREHHRVYDHPTDRAFHAAEDPRELFISFPFFVVGPVALIFVAAWGWLRGWPAALPYAAGLYFFMLLDHRLHILFHRTPSLPGVLGRLQQMHRIHHQTHSHNFFFVSGLLWDLMLGTAATRPQPSHSACAE